MSSMLELFDHPPLHEPVLIVSMAGWIDAGNAASSAVQAILDSSDSELIGQFDTDVLLDYRSRRPIVDLYEGWVRDLSWPSIELLALVDEAGRHVLVLSGAEPDHAWGGFTSTVVDTAMDLGVGMVVSLGAYPAPVPHTRAPALSMTSPSEDLLDSFPGFVRGTIEVPAGVQTAIEVAAYESGIPSLGLWAQIPHYISGLPYPAGAVQLIEGLQRVAGLSLPVGDLPTQAANTRSQIDELVSKNDQHQAMVAQLEELADSTDLATGLGPLPTGDELAAEFQAFLRRQSDEG
jgi:predicted ATP-grasp superfamily ATP-dependent carboligase